MSPVEPSQSQSFPNKARVGLFLAPLLGGLVYVLPFTNLPHAAHILAGILTWVVVSWVTEALPLAITSLLGAALCVLAGLGSVTTVFATFAHPIIFLFIGSFFLAEAFVAHGVDHRFAVWLLSMKRINGRPAGLFMALACATAFLSMWISNTAAVAIMVPMVLGILSIVRKTEKSPGQYEIGALLLLAYSAAAGGIATVIGTPPNLIGVGLLSQQANINISFFQWLSFGLPLSLIMLVLISVVLKKLYPLPPVMPALWEHVRALKDEQGYWTRGQINTCVGLAVAVCCWVGPGLLGAVIGRDADVVNWLNSRLPKELVPIFAAGLLFVLPVNWKAGEFTLNWRQASHINWGTILLFGGGLTFGHLMVQTGLASAIGEGMVRFLGSNTLWNLTAVGIVTALILTEIASNTAAASMLVPVVIAIAQAADVSPVPPTLGVCLAGSLAFVLPVSTPPNAIVYGTGLIPLGHMIRAGLLLDLIGGCLVWLTLWILCPLLGLS